MSQNCTLACCRIQLELVEDKLRELRLLTLDPREYDDKTVTLSQLDRVRQELLATAKGELKYVTFGKVRPGLHADAVPEAFEYLCRLQITQCTGMQCQLMPSRLYSRCDGGVNLGQSRCPEKEGRKKEKMPRNKNLIACVHDAGDCAGCHQLC